ncbi:MAG: RNA methyltransferase [Pirellulaceae bacterium]|jgi:tRNA G18 (ribose-2'-O)-methylase SpoU|nr:RNA methyltransferase [Pirellulaceae bacterium]MDP7018187.1 RNA methyltransferase [Pirellulaceae bacterium]
MTLISVDDLNDPRLDDYRDLTDGKAARAHVIAEGQVLVERLAKSQWELRSIVAAPHLAELALSLVPADTPVYVVDKGALNQLLGFKFHRGVLAAARRPPPRSAADLLVDLAPSSTIVVCCGICDPENIGVIVRSAMAFGADRILLGPGCGDPYSRRVLRTSMGAVLNAVVAKTNDLSAELKRIRNSGVRTCAAVVDRRAAPLHSMRRHGPLAIVLGPEGPGLDAEIIRQCDHALTIPIHSEVDSLNVASAAAVLLNHFAPRRRD